MQLFEPQPASLMYMFDGGWWVLRYVVEHVWARTAREAQTWFTRANILRVSSASYSKLHRKYNVFVNATVAVGLLLAALGALFGGLWAYYFALVIVALFTVLQVVFLLLGVIIASILVAFLTAGNLIYGEYYKIRSRCPVCHEQMLIPVYLCSKCGEKHTRLWPSAYGIFYHRCAGNGGTCGEKLPTLGLLGRGNLKRTCENGHPLTSAHGATTPVHFPIVGGPAAGKSQFILMAIQELIDNYAPRHSLKISIPDEQQRKSYEADIAQLKTGQVLSKTFDADDSAQAYNVEIQRPGRRINYLAYFYDAAGESFQTMDRALQQDYFEYVQGILMVVDPFSIPKVEQHYANDLALAGAQITASKEPLDNIYGRMIEVLASRYPLKRNQRYPYPIAVVLTKTDVFDLETHIGEVAQQNVMKRDPNIQAPEAMNIAIEEFLTKYGADNFVRNLHTQFSNVRLFSCSALGHTDGKEDINSLQSRRIVKPVIWLFENTGVLPAFFS